MSYKKVKLSEICTIEKGATGITKAIEGEYPMVTMAEARTSHNEYQFDTKAVLIPLVSSSGHGHASMKRIHYQEGKFAVGSILCALVPKNEDEVNARFLYNYLNFQKETLLVRLMRGAANVSLSIKSISSVEINLPPLETQISINKLVDDFKLRQDVFQTELKTQSNLLSKLRQAYLQEAVMGKLSEPRLSGFKDDRIITNDKILQSYNLENHGSDKLTDDRILDEKITDKQILQSYNSSGATSRNHSSDRSEDKNTQETGKSLLKAIKSQKAELIKQGKLRKEKPLAPIKPEEIPFEIPDNWVWCRLGDLGNTTTGTTPPTIDKDNFGDDFPFIKPADITNSSVNYCNEGLSFKGIRNGRLIPLNSILMVCIGGSIGKCYYVERDCSCNQQINVITPIIIDIKLLTFFLQSKYFQKSIWSVASGGTTPIVNKSKWEQIPIPLPPLSEQKAIVAKVEGLLGNISLLESENKAQQIEVQRLMGAVLQEAFGGR